jgi:phage protein D
MTVGNGKDPDGVAMPEIIAAPCEGSEVLQMQLAQLAAMQDQQQARAAFEAQRQQAVAFHKAELARAVEDFIAARKAGDHGKEAEAVRRISRAEVRLMHLGAYSGQL